MELVIKPTKNKKDVTYKSLYIEVELVEVIYEIAKKYNTSFNNVVISIIKDSLNFK